MKMVLHCEKYYLDIYRFLDGDIYFEFGDNEYTRDILTESELDQIIDSLEDCINKSSGSELLGAFTNTIHNSKEMYLSVNWNKSDDEFVLSVRNKRNGVDFEIHLNRTEFLEFVGNCKNMFEK